MSAINQFVVPASDAGLIVPVESLAQADREIAGGKAVNLATLLRAGLAVPPGVCLTTRAFGGWLANCRSAEPGLRQLRECDPAQTEVCREVAAAVRRALAQAPLPEPVAEALRRWWNSGSHETGVAVRSSAVAEDLKEASFAGQYDSILRVREFEQLLEAVRACWISLFSERAVLYRARNGFSSHRVAMAVIIQEMVPAETAGVIFTRDPISGDGDRMVVEAVRGLGETLVSGTASPSRFFIDSRSLGPTCAFRAGQPAAAEASATNRAEVGLADGALSRLAAAAQSVERLFGCPQDIEWAIHNGAIWLLQARPITTARTPASAAAAAEQNAGVPAPDRPQPGSSHPQTWRHPTYPGVWTRANMCENMPDAVTPMSWSVMETVLLGSFKRIFQNLGTDLGTHPWIDVIGGYGYLNLASTEDLLGGPQLLRYLHVHQVLGGQDPGDHSAASCRPRSRRRLGFAQLSGALLMGFHFAANLLHFQGPTFVKQTRDRVDRVTRTDLSALSDDELVRFICEIGPRMFPELQRQVTAARLLGTFGCGLACGLAAPALAGHWLKSSAGQSAARLVCGPKEMASAEAGRDLVKLADWARAHPAVAQVISARRDFATCLPELRASETGREFLALWEQFMARHGHRGRGEMDVYTRRWGETPDYVLDLLRAFLAPERRNQLANDPALKGDRLWAACRQGLRNPLKRAILGLLVRRGREGLALRENVKGQAIRLFALIRRALLEAGRRLEERGVLASPDDVFFLDLAELRQVLCGKATFAVQPAVAERRTEHAYYRTIEPPALVIQREGGRVAANGQPSGTHAPRDGQLQGLPVSPGVARGPARVILHADVRTRLQPGEVLVAPFTDPGWTPYFLNAAAIVVDMGGLLSHGSVVAREYGIPAVVNVGDGTKRIQTGQLVEVDGNTGIVRMIS